MDSDALRELERLSLISKVCTEIENHLGSQDEIKDLGKFFLLLLSFPLSFNLFGTDFQQKSFFTAEFVIHLAEQSKTFDKFKKELVKNGAEFSDSLIASLLRLIQHMTLSNKDLSDESSSKTLDNIILKDNIKTAFPSLSRPNDPSVRVSL